MAAVGDVDLDGHDYFIVGAPNDFVNGVQSGSIQVFSGADFSVLHQFGRTVRGVFGIVVAGGGDVNADGTPDFAAADTQDLSNSNEFSRVIVYSGVDGSILRQFGGNQIFDAFGYGLVIAADVDGDGHDDVAIGAPAETDSGGGIPGVMRVYSGLTGGLLYEEVGPVADDFVGYGLAADAIGDLNGDGKDELVVGAPYLELAAAEMGLIHVVTAADLGASWQNYGAGWPGTLCTPNLVASAPPAFGTTIQLALENSSGVDSFALLIGGFAKSAIPTSKGGTLLVATPWLVLPLSLPAAGITLGMDLPIDVTLAGFEIDVQALELDAGASHGLSFTPGLELILGA